MDTLLLERIKIKFGARGAKRLWNYSILISDDWDVGIVNGLDLCYCEI